MLAQIQRSLGHCQPAKDRHRINSLTRDQRLFAKSTIWLAVHFTLFSDGAKHCSFPVNFPAVTHARN